jgi:hypothetical protein
MLIFRHIFLSNYWWQRSGIWSQASYRYPILWEAFFDPSDSYFLFVEEWGYHKWALVHNSSCLTLSWYDIPELVFPNVSTFPSWRVAANIEAMKPTVYCSMVDVITLKVLWSPSWLCFKPLLHGKASIINQTIQCKQCYYSVSCNF